jgi:hypothetical protein
MMLAGWPDALQNEGKLEITSVNLTRMREKRNFVFVPQWPPGRTV